jgi:hypothetical protein
MSPIGISIVCVHKCSIVVLCKKHRLYSTPNVATSTNGWVKVSNHVVSNCNSRTTNAIYASRIDYTNNYVKPGNRNPDPVRGGQTTVWQGCKIVEKANVMCFFLLILLFFIVSKDPQPYTPSIYTTGTVIHGFKTAEQDDKPFWRKCIIIIIIVIVL